MGWTAGEGCLPTPAYSGQLRREGRGGRKVIVVITDGVDQGSRMTRNQAIEAAQKSDAVIHSVDLRFRPRVRPLSGAAAAKASCAR